MRQPFPAPADGRGHSGVAPQSGDPVSSADQRPRVVIVGGGFGGLAAAIALRKQPVQVTLIDRQNHHCFQPLLYQVATAALSPADVAWPIRYVLRKQRNATVLMEEVTGIDLARREVFAGAATHPYDFLVLAPGASYSYFGHQEWAPVAPGLKRIDDATLIRQRILLAFERAELASDADERRRQLTFVIVGGGPTGVELAGAIAELAHKTLPPDFRRADPGSARIVLVEAGPRLLPSFPERLSRYAQKELGAMAVDVRTGTMVTSCDERRVIAGGSEIATATIIWAAGVVAAPLTALTGAETDRSGRVLVRGDLSIPGASDAFVIGDAAAVPAGTSGPVPGLAPAAKQMGSYVGAVISRRVAGTAPPGPFRYRNRGELATIGRRAAIVKFGRFQLTGFVGWVFWSTAHIYFLIGLRNRLTVAISWLWQYVTFQRGARLIT
jgi:NADH dehydrogenase